MVNRSDEEKEFLNEFLPNVAAQIRAPLGIIHASLQKIAREHEEIPAFALVNQSYYQLLRLAGNLSATEMLTEELGMLNVCDGDIIAFCAELCGKIAPLAKEKGITLTFECEQESHVIAYDAHMIERMLLNLFSNALKFTPSGGKVKMTIQEQKADVLLKVRDTGCGITQKQMEVLFERYLHSDRLDPQPHGLGLGLPLSRTIVQAHDGRIFVQSQVGKGTQVTVALPNRKSMIQQVHDVAFDYVGGFNHIFVELADALPSQIFAP